MLNLTPHQFVTEALEDTLAGIQEVRSALSILEARVVDANRQYHRQRRLRSRSIAELRKLAG